MTRICCSALAASVICLSNCASADDRIACAPDFYIEAKSMADLPDMIRTALTNAPHKSREISDASGPFNAGDVGGGPYRRLAVGAIGLNHVFAALEQGGTGYSVEVWSFMMGADGWSGELQAIVFKPPSSSSELIGMVCK